MPDLVGNPEEQISHVVAHLSCYKTNENMDSNKGESYKKTNYFVLELPGSVNNQFISV